MTACCAASPPGAVAAATRSTAAYTPERPRPSARTRTISTTANRRVSPGPPPAALRAVTGPAARSLMPSPRPVTTAASGGRLVGAEGDRDGVGLTAPDVGQRGAVARCLGADRGHEVRGVGDHLVVEPGDHVAVLQPRLVRRRTGGHVADPRPGRGGRVAHRDAELRVADRVAALHLLRDPHGLVDGDREPDADRPRLGACTGAEAG